MDLQRSQHTRVSVAFTHVRKEGARALVTGIAYPALDPPEKGAISAEDAALRIDTYKTWMRRATLRAFAHTFLKRGTGGVDAHHDHGTVGTIVESYLTTEGHPEFPPDVWVVTSEVYDSGILEQLDAGKIKGYSIEFVSEIAPQTLQVEGAGKVRTGEIVNPTPLFLSLVEKPAIRQPFTAVEFRAELDALDCGRVTRLVRVEETPMPTDAETAAESPVTTPAAAPAASTEPPVAAPRSDAPTPAETAPSDLVQAWRADFAKLLTGLQGRSSPLVERLPVAHRDAIDQALQRSGATRRSASTRADVTMFEEVWNENHEVWAIQDAMSSAFYLLTGCYYECVYYGSGSLEARLADFLANVDAFRPVLVDLVNQAAALGTRAELDALTAKATAVLGQRAGKALSKKNLETIKGCRDAAKTCLDGLQGMVDTYDESASEASDDDEGERSVRTTTAPVAAPDAAPDAAPAAAPDTHSTELVALRARLDALATEVAATQARATATDAEATRLRAELATTVTAKEAAEARAAALEAAPLPSHAGSIETVTTPAAAPAETRWSGFAPFLTPRAPDGDG